MNNVLGTKMNAVFLLFVLSTIWSVVAGLDFTVVNDGSTVAARGFVGCYYARTADPAYAGTYYLRNDTEAEDIDSPIKCLTHCSGQGYAYFGLICPTETEITCVCSNDLPDTELSAAECAGGTLSTATGCGSSQGICTGVTASDLYAYEGYYVGGCEREAVFSTEQRAIATCTLTTPGVVDQVVVDSVDVSPFMLGTETSYTISFDGSSREIGLKMAGDDCSASGLSITCACSTCVTATCADCLWHGFELTNTSKHWKGWGTDTTLSGAWYLPSFDFSEWYYPGAALSGACFDNMPAPAYWYMVGGPEHYCEFEQCKVCEQEEISDSKNPRCIRSHPNDFVATMDPYATSLLSLNTATATCAEGAGAGDIICGDYVRGELAQETCTADPIDDYNCDVEVCDVRDLAGNCYHYHNIPATFAVAESTCLLRGGHIAYTPDSRVSDDLIGFLDELQTPPGNTWLGIRSKALCKFEPVDGSIEIGETRWEISNPDRCLASVSGGCGLDWKTTTDQDCCAQLTPSGSWESQPCSEERTFFCVTSTTSQYPDVSYVQRFLTCDYDETTCPPDSYSANGRLLGTECRGSCDESCQVSGDCEFDTDCDSCDVCDVGGCDDPSCDADGCDGAGCDNISCDEGSCDAAGCDKPSCDTKGCDQPSCDADSCDYASCDVQSCDAKGCDAAGCDVTSCDNPSCDSTSCDDGGCDANSCDDAACDEASCDLGGCDLGGCDDPSCDEPSCDRETCTEPSCDDDSCDAGGCDAPSCDENGCDLGGCDANGCDGDGCDGYGCDDPSCDRDCDTDCLANSGVCDSGEVCNTPDNSAAPEFYHGSCDYDAACDGSGAVFDSDCDFDSSCDKSACTNGVTCDGDEECDAAVCEIDGTNCDADESCDADDGCDAADCSTYGGEACDNGLGDCTSQASYCDGDEECDALLCEGGVCDGDESCDFDESCDDVNCAQDFVAATGGVCDGDENCSPTADCDAAACASDAENCDGDEGCDADACSLDVTDAENCDSDESCDATTCSANAAVCDSDESCDGFVGICSAGGLSDPANCDGDESCDDDAGCDYDTSCDKATCTFVQGDSPLTSAYNTTTCDQDESCDFDGGCDRAACNGETFCDGDEKCDRPTCEVGGYCDSNDEGCDLVACEADELDCDDDEECDGWVDGACEADIANCDLDEECDAGWADSPCDQYPDPVCDGDESCDLPICEAEYDIDLGESANCDGDENCDLDDSCDMSICEGGGACDGDEECDQASCEGHGLSAKEYEVTYGNLDGFNSSYCDDAVNDELCDFDEDCDNAACDDSIDMTSCDLDACTYGNFCDDDEGCNFDDGCDNNGGCDFDEECDFDESCDYDDSCDNDQSCDWDEGCDLDEDLLGSCDRSCDTATCDDTECDLCSGDCQICSDCLRCEENCPSGQYRQGCGGTSQGACVACTNIAEKHFFNSHGRLRDQCKTVECTQNCPIGQYNDNCEFTTSDDENCVDCTPTPGYYFIDDGGTSDSCTARLCNLDCPRGQYLAGCGGTNAGACSDCTEIPAGYFFKTNGRLLDNCEHEPCFTDCPFGEFNLGCEGTSPGVCSNCTAPPAGYYFTSNGGLSDSCTVAECSATTTCPIGEWNYGCDQETTPGTCIKCTNAPAGYYYSGNAGVADACEVTECTLECPKGQYNAGCSGTTDPSQCAECDKPPDGYYFTSFGDYRSDSCTSEPCVADCPSGQFKAGCDGKPPVLLDAVEVGGLCANCSLPPIGYYITGAGSYYDNCPSSPCKGCNIGFYRAGCDGTTSAGTCEACNVTDGSYILTPGTNDDPNSCHTVPCIDDCEIGYYKEGCSFTSNGTCTNCTILPEGFYFTSNGNFADACEFKHGKVKFAASLGNVFAGGVDGSEIFGNDHSIIATGTDNTLVSSAASVLVGGASNSLNGASGTIAGGQLNALYSKGAYSTIAGGYENVAGAKFVTVAGGRLNRALSNYATVIGGYGNKAFGKFATVIGGSRNTASGLRSTAMGYLGFARATNSMVWAFDADKSLGCKVEKTDPNQLQVCTQSFVVNGEDFLSMLDNEADDNANTCSDVPGDGITAYCQQTGLEVGTECVKNLASCSGSGRATVICEAGDAGAIAVGAQWSDPICLECPPDGCYGHDCHYYMEGGAGGGSYTCDVLEASYGCDCAACSCGSRRLSEKHSAFQDETRSNRPYPCDSADGCNLTTVIFDNSSSHAALTEHLQLSKRLHDVKAAYHQELEVQHEHLATVSRLMQKVEKLQAIQNKGKHRHELDDGFPNPKTPSASKEQPASVRIPRQKTRSERIIVPSPTPSAFHPTPSPMHSTPKNLGSVTDQNVVRPPRSAFDLIYGNITGSPPKPGRHRRSLSTRKDLLVAQVNDVAALAADIATIRSTMSSVQRLPADTASTPSGSCTDPAIVYDGSNVYVCDGSAWTALTPV